MGWVGHVALIWPKRNAYKILVGKSEGKRPLGRPRRRWMDNIKIDLRRDGVVWTGLMGLRIGRAEGSCEHGNGPSGSIKCWEVIE
jgi:hypothetical protein